MIGRNGEVDKAGGMSNPSERSIPQSVLTEISSEDPSAEPVQNI